MTAKVLKSTAKSETHSLHGNKLLSAASGKVPSSSLYSTNEAPLEPPKPQWTFSGPPSNYSNRRCSITSQRVNELRRQAQTAIKEHRIFTIRGCFGSVRTALLVRGWVEKLDVHRRQPASGVSQVTFEDLALSLPKRRVGEARTQYVLKCERQILSRFLEHMPIDFLWTNRKEKCDFSDQAKNPAMTINRLHRTPFTSKEGLCSQLKEFHWHYEPNIAELCFPRCFNVWSPEEFNEFVENFKLTASMAFVRRMVTQYEESGFDGIFSTRGTIPFSAVDFAYQRCSEYLEACQHNDIDAEDPPRIWEHEWDAFLQHQQQLLLGNESSKILVYRNEDAETTIRKSIQLLEQLSHCWAQFSLDGHQNLWIVKPANNCRGRGIQLTDDLRQILRIVGPSAPAKSRFVVQKYIERPLIIYNTKFDIRQWFLITSVQPLVVWMYKECYLRFSSQEYSLANPHESVHLTNHAVQKKYANGKRDLRLPSENMWDIFSFQAYLRQIGKAHMWQDSIYPGMRKAIVGTMLASQENVDRHPNTFELFGADFMITEDFRPWLIEINSSPDLGATTSVTARMCPQCLEDVIKVVVDRRSDPKADVGNFELAYRQVVPPTLAYMGLNLSIKGKSLVQRPTVPNQNLRRETTLPTTILQKPKAAASVHRAMLRVNAAEYPEKCGSPRVSRHLLQPMQQDEVDSVLTSSSSNLLKAPFIKDSLLRSSLTMLYKPCIESEAVNKPASVKGNLRKRHCSCGPRLDLSTKTPLHHGNQFECSFRNSALRCTDELQSTTKQDEKQFLKILSQGSSIFPMQSSCSP